MRCFVFPRPADAQQEEPAPVALPQETGQGQVTVRPGFTSYFKRFGERGRKVKGEKSWFLDFLGPHEGLSRNQKDEAA